MSSAASLVTRCLECDTPLSLSETQGLCGRCVLKIGLVSQFGVTPTVKAGAGKATPPPQFPFDFGGYRVLCLLGRGGMGAVYEAEELESGRRVALKVLGHSLDSPDTRKRFLREGRLAASINHPNSVYVYGTEEIDETPVITMELVPGGTLQERVKEGGPLPVGEAVDAILQIIAGLETAHAVGILHRDIKPANCFIEPSGTVKVGDFGLSISTVSRGDSALTLAGSILGTPEFSSPEQLRGEELNVRSDIYSVGMTLYYLLTGKTAFRAENVVQLLAAVLDKPPQPPREIRAEIPEALSQIVLRCLAKQAAERPASYDELRRALLPFNSSAPTPATLGLRFLAGVIDHVIFMIVSTLLMVLFFGFDSLMDPINLMGTPQWLWFSAGVLLFQIVYFAAGEGRWGATLGKALMGLRVGGLDRNAAGIPRALLRALIYMVPTMLTVLRLREPEGWAESLAWNISLGAALWVYPALLALTARRRNGFATMIDLLTKTRVIQKSDFESRESFVQIEEPVATIEGLPQIGPFHALATLSSDGGDELILGYDRKLMRRVWIRNLPADAPPVGVELRNAARPARLRWLQGLRSGNVSWDAYEAAAGTPLTSLLREPQPWKSVRHWLFDLAEEFDAAKRDGSMPTQLSLDRVWITTSGGAKLLDFRAPGAEPSAETIPGAEAAAFLNQLAISALEGRQASAAEARSSQPCVPVALRARGLLSGLRLSDDFAALAAQLRALLQQRPAILRRRRLGLVLGCVIPSLIMGGSALRGDHISSSWRSKNPDVMRLKTALITHERMQRGKFPPGVDPTVGAQALEAYIAGRFGHVLREPGVWSSPFVAGIFSSRDRQSAAEIVARYGQPSEEAMTAARAALGPAMAPDGELTVARQVKHTEQIQQSIRGPMALGGFFWAAISSLAAALLFRGGVLMRALGIAVVTRDGADASRGRMLWRACIAWSWLPLGALLITVLAPAAGMIAAVAVATALVIAVVIWSAGTSGRSLQDRFAATWLVPR
jgi:uncharacterized RDD family membrane protein YckC